MKPHRMGIHNEAHEEMFIIQLIQQKEFVIRRISMVIVCSAMVAFAIRKDAVEKGFTILSENV